MVRTVAVGVDGSATAAEAVKMAAELARWFEAELVLHSAYNRPLESSQQREVVARTEARLRQEGVRCRTLAEEGYAADVLVRLAKKCGADILVVGNKGMKRRELRSVPNSVTHQADCSVGPRRQDDVARRSAAPGLPIGAGFRPHPMRHSICDSDGDSRWSPSRRVAPVVGCPDHRFRLGGPHRLWRTVLCTRWRVVRRDKRSRWSGVRARVAKSPRDLHAPERQPADRSGLASLPGQVETSNRTRARSLPIGVGHLAAHTPSVANCAASTVWMRPTVVMGHQRL
jgi:nucleotide-binding universal stress UspA family protein